MRHPRSHGSLVCFTSLLLVFGATATAEAAPKLRVKVDQRGDFVLFGNTLGMECDAGAPAPTLGTAQCGPNGNRFGQPDSPDIYWRSDAPLAGQAEALQASTAAQARSTAMLAFPADATITHAFLYWSGAGIGNGAADTTALIERPGVFSQPVTAIDSYKVASQGGSYASVADVTALFQTHGAGAYRVGGVASNIVNQDDRWAGWWVVVFYDRPLDPPRNLVLSDMFDFLQTNTPIASTLTDFLVPAAGFDAKLGVVTFEGDGGSNGDRFFFNPSVLPPPNGEALSNALNPADNFFNSSHTHLGAAVSTVGDLPQLSGLSQSMGGMDMDVIDVTSKLKAGDTTASIHATTTGDVVMFATLVTSISTFKPDFNSSNKTVVDLNGGATLPGDVLEYTVVATNNGNDASSGTVLTDALPVGITYVANSTTLDGVALSDTTGNDVGDYDAGTRTITVRLGTGATSAVGGSMAIGATVTVKFQATLDATAPSSIANQAVITAGGVLGAPTGDTPTDGNGAGPGAPPTTITVDKCASNTDCATPTPLCDTSVSPKICVGCLTSTDCSGTTPICGAAQTCVACGPGAACGALFVCAGTGACLPDADGDGLSDADEGTIGTDPNDADSDDDGVPDGQEPSPSVDSDGDGLINALDPDSDNDGIFDGTEMGLACAGAGIDLTKKTCVADADPATTTNPLAADTDAGGVRDGAEDVNHDGKVDAGETDPNVMADDATNVDTDGDGLSDAEEDALGTSKTDADSDDDGVPDGQEVNPSADTDGDNKINALDPDSDGDGLFDGTELGLGCASAATNVAAGNCIADADPTTKTSPVIDDTDGGGKKDGAEDPNHDGKIDASETDPNNAADDTTGAGGAAGAAGTGGSGGAGAGGAGAAGAGAGGAGAAGKAGAGGAGAAGSGGKAGSAGTAGAGGKAGSGGTSGTGGASGAAGKAGSAGAAGAGGKAGSGGTSGASGSAGKAGSGGASGAGGKAGSGGAAGAAGQAGSAGKAGSTGTGAGAGGAPQATPTNEDIELEGAGLCSVGDVGTRESGSAIALLSLLGLSMMRRRRAS